MIDLSQAGIVIFGASAVYLVGRTDKWKRWGYVLGLCAQPFWFYTTWQAEQWGIFAISIWYAYSWANGIYNYWIKDTKS